MLLRKWITMTARRSVSCVISDFYINERQHATSCALFTGVFNKTPVQTTDCFQQTLAPWREFIFTARKKYGECETAKLNYYKPYSIFLRFDTVYVTYPILLPFSEPPPHSSNLEKTAGGGVWRSTVTPRSGPAGAGRPPNWFSCISVHSNFSHCLVNFL